MTQEQKKRARESGRAFADRSVIAILIALVSIVGLNGTADAAVSVLEDFSTPPEINDARTTGATTTYDPPAGSNRVVVIAVTTHTNNTTATAITVDYGTGGGADVPARLIVNSDNAQRRQAWFFYLNEADLAAAPGNLVTVNSDNVGNGYSVNIATYDGVDQAAPITASASQYSGTTTVTSYNYPAPISGTAGGWGIMASVCNQSASGFGESYTVYGETLVGTAPMYSNLIDKAFASAGTTDPGVTNSAAGYTGVAGLTLDPAAASAGSIALSSATYSVGEAGASVTITASRTGGSSGAVGASYGTANGTATAGSDYTTASGTLAWADGDTADKTFNVTILDDGAVEGDETFTASLNSPTGGATLGSPSSATVTITDDDVVSPGSLQLSSATYSVAENGTSVLVTVTRTGGSSGIVGVSYTTANGTASSGSDYTAASGSLSWADGETADKTFNVTILDDGAVEGDETFTASLNSPTGGASLGSPASSTVTITDDEAPSPQVPAGNAFLFTVLAGAMAYFAMRKRTPKEGA